MQCECWLPIQGYENRYEVSCTGKIKSLARNTSRIHKGKEVIQPIRERILVSSGTIYPIVQLLKDGNQTAHYVHHLVAYHFIGERPEGMQICHNDGNHYNSHVNNLRYDYPSGNAADRVKHGTDAIGENNPRAKLTETTVRNIKVDLQTMRQIDVARKYNLTSSTVGSIKQGKCWKHVKV